MPRSCPSSASVRISETSAEQPEPIITPTRRSAAAPSPPDDVAVLARRRQSRPNSNADAAAAPTAAPPGDAPLRQLHPGRGGDEHRAERAHRRAAGDAEDVRVGERVSGEQLHERARRRRAPRRRRSPRAHAGSGSTP
jgi:hypothetical protein